MTKIATASFTETVVPVPAGVTPAGRMATLMLADMAVGSPIAVEPGVPFSFTIAIAGTYHISVARVSTEGTAIAAPVMSDTFVVPAEVLMMNVPLTVTVTLADGVAVPTTVAVAL
jgi:hypothetical protein